MKSEKCVKQGVYELPDLTYFKLNKKIVKTIYLIAQTEAEKRFKAGKLNESLQIYESYLWQIFNDDISHSDLEKMEESDSLYEKALRLDSTNALINNNYAYSLSERGLQLERSLKMIEIAMNSDSSNSSYLDTYGWIFFKLEEYDKAYYYIKKAIDIGGDDNSVLLEHLGDVLFMQWKKDEALEMWKEAFELDSSNETLKQKIETGII